MRLHLESYKLHEAERLLCEEALTAAGSIVEAANLLGITRHALKRRIIKHRIEWPRKGATQSVEATNTVAAAAAE
ncbi:MAG TPA: helix-turn-helix domain-containing protein [Nannocystaceae bacterium]|nr:helix-turn-helix domain-containing protein [Nannocystaceae bacterium]